MKKILLVILTVILVQSILGFAAMPVAAADYPLPPQNPEASWQPPNNDDAYMNPPVPVQEYNQAWPNLQITPPGYYPGISGSIVSAYIVKGYGQTFSNLYRNESCYLVVSVNSPGYLYLWEYYPSGSYPSGHWLYYRYNIQHAGVWRIGPLAVEPSDPAGRYTWKMWFLAGSAWTTRTMSFNLVQNYYPPDLPGLPPRQHQTPVINSFSANKSSIEIGDSAILTWTTTNASNVTVSPGPGTVAATGNTSVNPATTTTYTLTARNESGDSVTSTATVTVVPRVLPVISVSQSMIDRGQSASLTWNAPGAVRVYITDVGDVANSGTMTVSPQQTATYSISAIYADNSVQTSSATVTVQQPSYLLWILIALLALAVIVVAILLARRPGRAPVMEPVAQTTQVKRSFQTEPAPVTQVADVLPETTPVIDAPAAKLSITNGGEIMLAGNARSFGRNEFEKYIPRDRVSYISRQHINIWTENREYFIEDRSSTNGTRINGVEIRETGRHQLKEGDVIDLAGKLNIQFHKA